MYRDFIEELLEKQKEEIIEIIKEYFEASKNQKERGFQAQIALILTHSTIYCTAS